VCFVRPFSDHSAPFQEDDDRGHGHGFFAFPAFPFNHDDMFRQLDEAFNNMMKNFGAFDGHFPDQEQGEMLSETVIFIIILLQLQVNDIGARAYLSQHHNMLYP